MLLFLILCFRTPEIVDYDFENPKQNRNVFNYFSYGVAISEVEIDVLTGNHSVSLLLHLL